MADLPELYIDNPGGEWLQGKLAWAQKDYRTAPLDSPRRRIGSSNVTGYFKTSLDLSPDLLKGFPGAKGEEAYRESGIKLENLQESIRDRGYEPSPILVHVREDGQPFIVEGNHRVAEALLSKRSTIPVDLRYLRGGETADGPLSPQKIKDFYSKRLGPRPKDQSSLPALAEGPPVEIGGTLQPSLITSEGGTPRFLYRIVSQQEYDAAQEKGSFSPSSSYGRHHASASPESQYLEPENNVLLRITYSPEDEWYSKWGGGKVYGVSSKDIPFSRAEKVTSGSSRDIRDFLKKFNEPRPPDPSSLPAVIDAAAAASRLAQPPDDDPRSKGKGQMFRGVGSLMKRRMFPLIHAAQMGYELLPEDKQVAGEVIDYLKKTKTHELFGLEKSGLEYFKDLLGLSDEAGGGTKDEFKKWFDQSVVTEGSLHDKEQPLTVYHGTSPASFQGDDDRGVIKDFLTLNKEGAGSHPAGLGEWFSESPDVAGHFAKGYGSIYPAHLSIQRPKYYDTYEDLENDLDKFFGDAAKAAKNPRDPLFLDASDFSESLIKQGYDGIVVENAFTDILENRRDFVAFRPEQIRSIFEKDKKAAGGFVDKPLYSDARMVDF